MKIQKRKKISQSLFKFVYFSILLIETNKSKNKLNLSLKGKTKSNRLSTKIKKKKTYLMKLFTDR